MAEITSGAKCGKQEQEQKSSAVEVKSAKFKVAWSGGARGAGPLLLDL